MSRRKKSFSVTFTVPVDTRTIEKKRDAKVQSLQEGEVLQGSDDAVPIQTTKVTKDGKTERTLHPPTVNPVLGVNAQLLEGG